MLILSFVLLGCANQYTTNGEYHYMQSKNGPKLVVPPPLTDANISDFYDLPAQNQDARVSINP